MRGARAGMRGSRRSRAAAACSGGDGRARPWRGRCGQASGGGRGRSGPAWGAGGKRVCVRPWARTVSGGREAEKEGASRGVAGHGAAGVEEEVGDDGDVVTRCSGVAACVYGVGDGRGRGGAPVDATGIRSMSLTWGRSSRSRARGGRGRRRGSRRAARAAREGRWPWPRRGGGCARPTRRKRGAASC